jgi:FkbM family methyltransferase
MRVSPRLLRPAKVRAAVRRRWFRRRLHATTLHDAPGVTRLGSSYGGWMIPEGLMGDSWVCYCVGAGGDTSFDMELIRRYGATVRAFDAVAGYVELANERAQGESRFSAHHAALAAVDGPIRMQVTHDPQSASVSSADLYDGHRYVVLPGRTLASLMAQLGDDHIDLLKIDIEGAEYELLPTLDPRTLGVKILSIQLHHTGSVRQANELISRLHDQGYEPVACLSSVKLTFALRSMLEAAGSAAPPAGGRDRLPGAQGGDPIGPRS